MMAFKKKSLQEFTPAGIFYIIIGPRQHSPVYLSFSVPCASASPVFRMLSALLICL
jgi:hypothetical protein